MRSPEAGQRIFVYIEYLKYFGWTSSEMKRYLGRGVVVEKQGEAVGGVKGEGRWEGEGREDEAKEGRKERLREKRGREEIGRKERG